MDRLDRSAAAPCGASDRNPDNLVHVVAWRRDRDHQTSHAGITGSQREHRDARDRQHRRPVRRTVRPVHHAGCLGRAVAEGNGVAGCRRPFLGRPSGAVATDRDRQSAHHLLREPSEARRWHALDHPNRNSPPLVRQARRSTVLSTCRGSRAQRASAVTVDVAARRRQIALWIILAAQLPRTIQTCSSGNSGGCPGWTTSRACPGVRAT